MEILKPFTNKVAFQKQRSHRIEALAYAVFAIIMTLHVLDIRILLKKIKTEYQILSSVTHNRPSILTFILSFSVAGLLWMAFTNQFNYNRETDYRECILAVFCFLPFSNSLLSEYLWSRAAIGIYVFNILVALLLYAVYWLYFFHEGLINAEDCQEKLVHKAILKRVLFYKT